jgi:hypothetical protein
MTYFSTLLSLLVIPHNSNENRLFIENVNYLDENKDYLTAEERKKLSLLLWASKQLEVAHSGSHQ